MAPLPPWQNFPCTKATDALFRLPRDTKVLGKASGVCPSPRSAMLTDGLVAAFDPAASVVKMEMFSATVVRKVGVQSSTRPPVVVSLAASSMNKATAARMDSGASAPPCEQALKRKDSVYRVDRLLVQGEIGASLLPTRLRPVKFVVAVVAPTGRIVPVACLFEKGDDIGLRVGMNQLFAKLLGVVCLHEAPSAVCWGARA